MTMMRDEWMLGIIMVLIIVLSVWYGIHYSELFSLNLAALS